MVFSVKTPEGKREEFKKYLDKSGVFDNLTKVLVGLYEEPERPSNAVEYIKKYMGAPSGFDIDSVRLENEQMKAKIRELEGTIVELNKQLKKQKSEK